MENHPIPQDVTGFQFKLIGEMTIKQFAYLALGVVLAWITYVLPLFWFLKFPIVLLFAGLGICLAFVPIEGRPFDVMLKNFLKALVSPSQFVFQKTGYEVLPQVHVVTRVMAEKPTVDIEKQQLSEKKLQSYLNTLPKTPKNSLDEKEMRFLGGLPLAQTTQPQSTGGGSSFSGMPTLFQTTTPVAQTPVQTPIATVAPQPVLPTAPHVVTAPEAPTPQEAPNEMDDQTKQTLENEAALIQQELVQAKQEEVQQQSAPAKGVAHEKVVELEKELASILAQKETLQNQLITLKKELDMQKKQVFTPGLVTAKQQTQNIRMVPQGLGKAVGLPIAPDTPNLLTGIVKDARGNTLPNILIEVKDKDNNPVRAFKTNGLGHFAAATPLSNGTYILTFEDPQGKQKFDTIELPVSGAIIQPLEIISADEREQLRKELFS